MERKICRRCKKEKHIDNFTKQKSSKDGYYIYCKECQRKRRRTPEGIIKERIKNAKYQKIKCDQYDILYNWYITIPNKCEYCGDDFDLIKKYDKTRFKKRGLNRLEIERIVPEKGYVAGNIIKCCERCNFIKSDSLFTYEEMKTIGKCVHDERHRRIRIRL